MTESVRRPRRGGLRYDLPLGGRLGPFENHRAATAFHNRLPPTPTFFFFFNLLAGGGCFYKQRCKAFNLVDVIPFFPMLTPLATNHNAVSGAAFTYYTLVFPVPKAEYIRREGKGALVFKKQNGTRRY